MTYEIEQVESFVRYMIDQYEESTRLDSMADLVDYNEDKHEQRDYFQMGKRSNLPKRFFEDEATLTDPLAEQLVDAITTSEVIGFLSSIKNISEEKNQEVGTYEISEFTYESVIVNSFDYVYDPDFIFIPNSKDWRMEIHDWRSEGRVKSKDDGLYIAGASDIELNWMPTKWDINEIILFNSEDIRLIQKRYQDVDSPEYIEPVEDFDAAEDNDRLMVYLGKQFKDNPDEFELLARSIVSKPQFTDYLPHAACVAKLTGDLSP
jgi:hypothetical protein